MKYLLFFIFYLSLITNVVGLNRLNVEDWDFITKYCLEYILQHQEDIEVSTNESGFYRIKVALPSNFNKDVIDFRLNYWGMDSKKFWITENIHNHPNYFESKIIFGGYEHELYRVSKSLNKDNKYLACELHKDNKNINNIISQEVVYLEPIKLENVTAKDTLAIDKKLIHRVVNFIPGTLSINVVFNDGQIKYNVYDVFFSGDLDPKSYINTRTKIVNQKVKKAILDRIINILNGGTTG